MAKNTLPVNYKDDILNSTMDGKRRYRMITNSDGTVSFEDVTTYDQVGSNFGAAQLNAANTAVNASADSNKIIDDLSTIAANTQEGYMAGALAVKELNQSLTNLKNPAKGTKGILVNSGSPLSKDCLLVYTLKTTKEANTGAFFSINGIKVADLTTRTPNNIIEIRGCVRAFKGDIITTHVASAGGYADVYAYTPNTI